MSPAEPVGEGESGPPPPPPLLLPVRLAGRTATEAIWQTTNNQNTQAQSWRKGFTAGREGAAPLW